MLLGFVIPVSMMVVGVIALIKFCVLIMIMFFSVSTSVQVSPSLVQEPSLSTSEGRNVTLLGISILMKPFFGIELSA